MAERIPNTNLNGDYQMSPKYLPPSLWRYLKEIAKKRKLTETAIVREALELHRAENE